jgi:hypothetical protein
MKSMLRTFYAKPLIVYLVAALIVISSFAGPADAMFVPAAPPGDAAGLPQSSMAMNRAMDLARIQTALESRIVQQKLLDYGLSPTEALARVNRLPNAQLHELASHTNSIQAGGDPVVDAFVGLVVVALLVVVLVFLLQHRIEVR